jgi:hypothetical protein
MQGTKPLDQSCDPLACPLALVTALMAWCSHLTEQGEAYRVNKTVKAAGVREAVFSFEEGKEPRRQNFEQCWGSNRNARQRPGSVGPKR